MYFFSDSDFEKDTQNQPILNKLVAIVEEIFPEKDEISIQNKEKLHFSLKINAEYSKILPLRQ